MATYAIGDVQGCFEELKQLLKRLNYDPHSDELIFIGDLVNRGDESLAVLQFVSQQPNAIVTLGNHDLYLLILGYGLMPEDAYQHTLDDVLRATDKEPLLHWLSQQPLMVHRPEFDTFFVHAGIPPQWTLQQALGHAHEIETILQDATQAPAFLTHLFGNEPATWSPTLTGQDRWRYIVNALTRIRFCDQQGQLDLIHHTANSPSTDVQPWFSWRPPEKAHIVFGHWASLGGQVNHPSIFGIDTGCIWGQQLTALCLDTGQRTYVDAAQRRNSTKA